MAADEKLQLMEALWESLSREEACLESPPWHKEGASGDRRASHEASGYTATLNLTLTLPILRVPPSLF
jgi:Putative addiction module component